MVNLLFLDSTSPSPFPLQANPTDSIGGLKAQLAAQHPSAPPLDQVALLRGGRWLKDTETVQDVLGGNLVPGGDDGTPHTIHLVLRGVKQQQQKEVGKGSTTSTSSSAPGPSTARPPPILASTSTPTSASPSSPSGVLLLPDDRVLDLSDAVSFYAHLSRSALCDLLSLPAIAWEDIRPAPQVSEEEAKTLVRQTMEIFGMQSGLGEGERGELENWVGPYGGEWSVEVDGLPYHLSVPPTAQLSPTQRTALHSYLLYSTRHSLLHQIIQDPLPYIIAMLPDSVTNRPTPPLTDTAVRRQSAFVRVVPMMLMNAIKYSLVWYIFTQREALTSRILWGLALLGWWVYEGMGEYRRAVGGPSRPPVAATPPLVVPNTSVGPETSDSADGAASSSAPAASPSQRPIPTFTLTPTSSPLHALALVGLQHEIDLLSLTPRSWPRNNFFTPTSQPPIATAPLPPPSAPSRTQALLRTLYLAPLLLLLTIAPPLEALRTQTIRRRETAMRDLVEALTPPNPSDASSGSAYVLPEGLGADAKAYYRRVLERGERIDWDAEEAAQREVLGREGEREREGDGGWF